MAKGREYDPQADKLYHKLLPIYQLNNSKLSLYGRFSAYYPKRDERTDPNVDYAGIAMKLALAEFGLLPLDLDASMQGGAEEYSDIIRAEEIMEGLKCERHMG